MSGIGVSLSGGGHRASLFALGVLLYLVDSGKNREVTSISSVSGGSLTNAFVGQALDFSSADVESFDRTVAPFVTQIARKGTFQGRGLSPGYLALMGVTLVATGLVWLVPGSWPVRFGLQVGAVALWAVLVMSWMFCTLLGKLYGVLLATTLAAAVLLPWFTDPPGWLATPFGRFVLFVAALLLWMWAIVSLRGSVCASSYRTTLFTRNSRVDRVDAMHADLDHILCATDLQSAEQVYFHPRFVYGYRFGLGSPGELRLSVAAQASANLPFAFPARWVRTTPFNLRYPGDEVPVELRPPGWRPCPPLEDRPSRKGFMVLSDGGVYDNMADQWPQGFANRSTCWPGLKETHHEPSILIVANASGGADWKTMKRSRIPGLGGLLSLLRVTDVLYDQTTAHRRAGLVGRFDRAALAAKDGHPGGMQGALVHIPQSPVLVPSAYRGSRLWPDRAARAADILPELEPQVDYWRQEAKESAGVGTVLSALGDEVSVGLLRHGYVLAMANLHTVLEGFPWLGVPSDDRFKRLLID